MDTNKIYNATNSQELHSALQEAMEEITREWWNELDDNAKNAIRLLGYSHTVVSSMMFFSDRLGSVYFASDYSAWGGKLVRKIEGILNENKTNNFLSSLSLTDCFTYKKLMNEVRNIITEKIVPLGLSKEIQYAAIEDLISKDEDYQNYRSRFYYETDYLRKYYLWEAFDKIKEEDNHRGE